VELVKVKVNQLKKKINVKFVKDKKLFKNKKYYK
jgi:hypothetical protein